jgi:hypothetical protein
MGSRAVEKGQAGEPFAYVLTTGQHDAHAAARLASLLVDNGIELHRAEEPFRAGGEAYPAGTLLVLMAQPFRAFAKTLLERQTYPLRRTPSGAIETPYDLAGWTLPLQMGVDVVQADHAFELPLLSRLKRVDVEPGRQWGERRPSAWLIDGRGLAGASAVLRLIEAGQSPAWLTAPLDVDGYRYAPGSILVHAARESSPPIGDLLKLGLRVSGLKGKPPSNTLPLTAVRTGLYKPWTASIDEGWTRLALEQHRVPFQTLVDADLRKGDLRSRIDVLILPSESPATLRTGHKPETVPPEYAGGMGEAGVEAIRSFVQAGGTLVALDRSSALAIELFGLPIKNAVGGLKPDEFLSPGSLLKLTVDPAQPLAFGLPTDVSALSTNSAAFDVADSSGTVRVVARIAEGNPLLSGVLVGAERVAGKAALVEATVGAGRVVLFGFRPQHRAQTLGTLRFLFNAIATARPAPAIGKG